MGDQKVKVHVDGDDIGPDQRQGKHKPLQDSGLAAVLGPQHGLRHRADTGPTRAQSSKGIHTDVDRCTMLLQVKHRLPQLAGWYEEKEEERESWMRARKDGGRKPLLTRNKPELERPSGPHLSQQ